MLCVWVVIGVIHAITLCMVLSSLLYWVSLFLLMNGCILAAEEGTEYIVVVICGLNDWRTMIERFPTGLGPFRFQQELRGLVSEVSSTLSQSLENMSVVFVAI